MGLGDLARQEQVLDVDRDLRQIDAGDAVLLGERADRVELGEDALVDEARRERVADLVLRAERACRARPA